jgi:hypothetical protein
MGVHYTYWLKTESTYLGWKSFFHGGECPLHSGPLFKANFLAALAFSLTLPHSLPAHRAFIFTCKDEIIKDDSSVGHNRCTCTTVHVDVYVHVHVHVNDYFRFYVHVQYCVHSCTL